MIQMRGNLIFPLALALILGGLSAWLESISEIQIEEVKLPPDQPQYLMEKMSGTRFDQQGQLRDNLNAERAWQLPNRKEIYLQSTEFQTYENNTPQYRIESGQARYNVNTRNIVFEHGVLLSQDSMQNRLATEISTSNMMVDTQNRIARTDAEVEYRYGQSHGTAQGLVYDHQQGKLNFPAKVKALIYDQHTHQE